MLRHGQHRSLCTGCLVALALVALSAGCAQAQPATQVRPTTHPRTAQELVEEAKAAIRVNELDRAQALLDRAAEGIESSHAVADDVAYTRATLSATRGELEEASEILLARLPDAEAALDEARAFWLHNALMMIREAQGDLPAALAENDEATLFAARATFEPDGMSRGQLAEMKDLWHRAYLVRMMAERRTGSARSALVSYAERAREAYTEIARPLPQYQDSIAVLDGLFAALEGKAEQALAAANRVDVENNGDFEDLFLTAVAFRAGGDVASAEAIRARIEQSESVYLARPIMLEWLRRVEADPQRFSPLNPTGTP